jgi:hypothetical protein
MRLPRMTTRRWMVAVAVVAFLIAGTIEVPRLWNVRRNYLALAEWYGDRETRLHENTQMRFLLERARRRSAEESASVPSEVEKRIQDRIARMDEMGTYYGQIRAKYERGARYPWLPLEPDPPMPW